MLDTALGTALQSAYVRSGVSCGGKYDGSWTTSETRTQVHLSHFHRYAIRARDNFEEVSSLEGSFKFRKSCFTPGLSSYLQRCVLCSHAQGNSSMSSRKVVSIMN